MSIFRLPPSPHIGGRQPLEGRERVPDEVVVAATADNPPGVEVPRIVVVPDEPLPTLPSKIAAIVTVNPVAVEFLPQRKLIDWIAFASPDPLPTLRAKLNPSLLHVHADTPPFSSRRYFDWRAFLAPDLLPTLSGKVAAVLAPAAAAATVDNPPGKGQPRIVTIDDPHPQQRRNFVVQEGAAAPAQADNPPFGLRRPKVWTWGPTVAYPIAQGDLVPLDEDDPPFSSRHHYDWRAWIPPPPLPTLRAKLNPSLLHVDVVVVANDPPFNSRKYWDEAHWFYLVPYKLVVGRAATEGVTEEEPPAPAPAPDEYKPLYGEGYIEAKFRRQNKFIYDRPYLADFAEALRKAVQRGDDERAQELAHEIAKKAVEVAAAEEALSAPLSRLLETAGKLELLESVTSRTKLQLARTLVLRAKIVDRMREEEEDEDILLMS